VGDPALSVSSCTQRALEVHRGYIEGTSRVHRGYKVARPARRGTYALVALLALLALQNWCREGGRMASSTLGQHPLQPDGESSASGLCQSVRGEWSALTRIDSDAGCPGGPHGAWPQRRDFGLKAIITRHAPARLRHRRLARQRRRESAGQAGPKAAPRSEPDRIRGRDGCERAPRSPRPHCALPPPSAASAAAQILRPRWSMPPPGSQPAWKR
jgi:hypothetical protein